MAIAQYACAAGLGLNAHFALGLALGAERDCSAESIGRVQTLRLAARQSFETRARSWRVRMAPE